MTLEIDPNAEPRTAYFFDPKKFRKITLEGVRLKTPEERALDCQVYWGSHGCDLPKGHEGHHVCDCCLCDDHERDHKAQGCVGKFPYYGSDTNFYGKDA